MTLQLETQVAPPTVEVHLTGKLTKEDYTRFVPRVEQMIKKHGKVRVLMELNDFHGWTTGALWEDFKFDLKHFNDIDRLAIIGEKKWEKGMATFCRPFTTAKIRYFTHDQAEEARRWVSEEPEE
jgi:SpoIIAA-like